MNEMNLKYSYDFEISKLNRKIIKNCKHETHS